MLFSRVQLPYAFDPVCLCVCVCVCGYAYEFDWSLIFSTMTESSVLD